jgi:3-phosphoshikimate 1-carboxyvinyltransferase
MPIVCALAARAHGTTRLRAVGGLRDEAVDRLAKLASALRLFGVACDARDDGIDVVGSDLPLQAAEVDGFGDPALAMTFVVLALVANGPTRVRRAQSIARVYPKFVATLRALGARVDVQN